MNRTCLVVIALCALGPWAALAEPLQLPIPGVGQPVQAGMTVEQLRTAVAPLALTETAPESARTVFYCDVTLGDLPYVLIFYLAENRLREVLLSPQGPLEPLELWFRGLVSRLPASARYQQSNDETLGDSLETWTAGRTVWEYKRSFLWDAEPLPFYTIRFLNLEVPAEELGPLPAVEGAALEEIPLPCFKTGLRCGMNPVQIAAAFSPVELLRGETYDGQYNLEADIARDTVYYTVRLSMTADTLDGVTITTNDDLLQPWFHTLTHKLPPALTTFSTGESTYDHQDAVWSAPGVDLVSSVDQSNYLGYASTMYTYTITYIQP